MALLASLMLLLVCLAPSAARAPAQLQRSLRLAAGGGARHAPRARRLGHAAMSARGAGGRPGAPRMPPSVGAAVSSLSSSFAPPLDPTDTGADWRGADARDGGAPTLVLLNSLSRGKEPFEPLSGGRAVSWYICGPTVYDSAHLGHLRNYVGFDIVRRVLEDYFGYDVCYVMNVTDIDDKLILRAHRRRLESTLGALDGALHAEPALAPPGSSLADALARARALLVAADGGKSLPALMSAQRALRDAAEGAGGGAAALASSGALRACEPNADLVALAREYEAEFFADMRRVNVRAPTAITRVTEYVTEVISYIAVIGRNGYCYATPDGSVYFDTAAFAAKHEYGKLKPTTLDAADEQALLREGEGALAEAEGAGAQVGGADGGGEGKRRAQDFALWKASKAGEPAWPSPWGAGRPGWHIECSAMASDLLGNAVDINAGGVDLKFPHHENQVAQCEAHFDCSRWVRTFLHSGHLSIDGRKMSKSLKNFITVDEALEAYSPSQLRFLFLLRGYADPMEYTPNAMSSAAGMHERFKEFLTSVDIRLRETEPPISRAGAPAAAAEAASARVEKWGDDERALAAALAAKKAEVHAHLCDAIDTAGALRALEQLLRETNRYLGSRPAARTNRPLLLEIGRYYARLLRTFGVTDVPEVERFSPFGAEARGGGTDAGAAGAGANAEGVAAPLVECLAAFRDEVRVLAAAGADGAALLALCDRVRDVQLRELGVRLEDRAGQPARWTLASAAELAAEAEAAARASSERDAARAAAQSKQAALKAMRAVPAAEMFLPRHDATFGRDASFSQWDERGLPTHGPDGEPLSKGARKKAEKAFAKQSANGAAPSDS